MDLQQWSQQWADSQIKEALEEGVDTTNDSEEQTEQCSHGEVAIGCGIHPFLERLLYLRIATKGHVVGRRLGCYLFRRDGSRLVRTTGN